jgi:hypothetical protein
MRMSGLLCCVLALAACGLGGAEAQARTAFEKAVATDAANLNNVPLSNSSSLSEGQQAFRSLSSEMQRFKSEVQSITYPDAAKADVDKLTTDLTKVADIAQRISASLGKMASGAQPSDTVSPSDFCSAILQAGNDANAVFNDLHSNEQYRVPSGC